MPLTAGTKLGPYEIQSPLGSGGMGEVFRARDTRLDRVVAIKILPTHLSSSPELKQRFDREARAISALNHPRICILHDVGDQDGVSFLVMEYLEGDSLAERLRKGPLSLKEALKIAADAGLVAFNAMNWSDDSQRIIYEAQTDQGDWNVYTQHVASGSPVRIAPGRDAFAVLSPNGLTVALRPPAGGIAIYSADGGQPKPLKAAKDNELPARFAKNGNALLVGEPTESEVVLTLIDLSSGCGELFKRIPAEAHAPYIFVTTPDLKYYAYPFPGFSSVLYTVENLK